MSFGAFNNDNKSKYFFHVIVIKGKIVSLVANKNKYKCSFCLLWLSHPSFSVPIRKKCIALFIAMYLSGGSQVPNYIRSHLTMLKVAGWISWQSSVLYLLEYIKLLFGFWRIVGNSDMLH